jgi:zinc transport system substrate-binding protein
MKKIIAILLSAFMLVTITACGTTENNNTNSNNTNTTEGDDTQDNSSSNSDTTEKLSIVTTIFPQYDWLREIIGENSDRFELTMLVDSSIDMHSYAPSVGDIATISTADLFIYVGGHSDSWTEDVLESAANEDMVVINLVEELGDKIITVEHDCDDDECDDDHSEAEDLIEEEHVWVSLKMAKALCEIIAEAVISLDPDDEEVYRSNLSSYLERIDALDNEYKTAISEAANDTLVFACRFPFLYMVNDYGLKHYAAFSGCSAETEISFSTIVILSRKVDELELKFVMVTEAGSEKFAETVIDSTEAKDQEIRSLDDFKTISSSDIESGKTYLSVMESNLEILKEVLN